MALDPTRVPLWVVTLPFISTGAVPQSKAGNVRKIEIRNRGRNKVKEKRKIYIYTYIYIYIFFSFRECVSTFYVGLAHAAPPIQYKAFTAFSINWLSEGSTSRYTCKEQQISSPG